ncbi:TPA: NYN domain-containing protein, partial [Klebsiella pneumoniae]
MERSKIALFVDVENLTQWIKQGGPEALIAELAATGQLIVRRAYGNWCTAAIQGFQSELNRLGFELIHNFHPISKKNSSDIQLTIDVMDHALRLQDVQWFVLATGDSDFSPLFRRLREMGKDVIGVGPRSPLSESVKTSCSKYIYTNLNAGNPGDSPKAIRSAIDDAMDMLERILQADDGPQPLAAVKSKILNIDSAFSEKALGFASFMEFVRANERVHVAQEGKNAAWTCQLGGRQEADEELQQAPLERQ